jgi:NAD(P)-dependent dehydrogenase (short-subunit alcohol dehydrogenase family)
LASKFNLAILTKRFSVQLKTHGIQVFAIAPFPFKTTNSKNAESIIQYIMPDNVARLILHCLLDFSHAVSGKVITLNGNKIFVDITD